MSDNDVYGLNAYLITPGFVDIYIHGCAGADTCDGIRKTVAKMTGYLITKGVTPFLPNDHDGCCFGGDEDMPTEKKRWCW